MSKFREKKLTIKYICNKNVDVRDIIDLGKNNGQGRRQMGGRGSGWQRERKTTVEEGLILGY